MTAALVQSHPVVTLHSLGDGLVPGGRPDLDPARLKAQARDRLPAERTRHPVFVAFGPPPMLRAHDRRHVGSTIGKPAVPDDSTAPPERDGGSGHPRRCGPT